MHLSHRHSPAGTGTRPPAGSRGLPRPRRRLLPPGVQPRRARSLVVKALVLALVAGALLGLDRQPNANAAFAADFDPGNIISDAVFFNSNAMSADQVQAFLNARGASCVAGEQPCLKVYVTRTVQKSSDGLCRGYVGGSAQSAAQIIAGVAQSCG